MARGALVAISIGLPSAMEALSAWDARPVDSHLLWRLEWCIGNCNVGNLNMKFIVSPSSRWGGKNVMSVNAIVHA
jgi:hypothetical protein